MGYDIIYVTSLKIIFDLLVTVIYDSERIVNKKGKKKMSNRKKMLDLMAHYRVDTHTVASILGLSPTTIRIYKSAGGHNIKDNDIKLLEYKLAENYKIK